VVFSGVLIAGSDGRGNGTRAVALSNACVALTGDPWVVQRNPASLAGLDAMQVGMFYAPQLYGIKELRTLAAAAAVQVPVGGAGVSVEQFGFDLYREMFVTAGWGFDAAGGLSAGLGVSLQSLSISHYGRGTRWAAGVGILAKLAEELNLGASVHNVASTTLGPQGDRLPTIFTTGVSWIPLRGLILTSELEKDLLYPVSARIGIEQVVWGVLALRGGISTDPDEVSAGFSVDVSGLEFGYAGFHHAELGWTHQIDLVFRMEK